MGHTFDHPKNQCTYCGYERDAVTAVEGGEGPKAGDVNVCLKCAGYEWFTETGYEPMNEEQFNELPGDIQKQMVAIRTAINNLKSGGYFTAPGEA